MSDFDDQWRRALADLRVDVPADAPFPALAALAALPDEPPPGRVTAVVLALQAERDLAALERVLGTSLPGVLEIADLGTAADRIARQQTAATRSADVLKHVARRLAELLQAEAVKADHAALTRQLEAECVALQSALGDNAAPVVQLADLKAQRDRLTAALDASEAGRTVGDIRSAGRKLIHLRGEQIAALSEDARETLDELARLEAALDEAQAAREGAQARLEEFRRRHPDIEKIAASHRRHLVADIDIAEALESGEELEAQLSEIGEQLARIDAQLSSLLRAAAAGSPPLGFNGKPLP
jgi:chromosome segregation ATPase